MNLTDQDRTQLQETGKIQVDQLTLAELMSVVADLGFTDLSKIVLWGDYDGLTVFVEP